MKTDSVLLCFSAIAALAFGGLAAARVTQRREDIARANAPKPLPAGARVSDILGSAGNPNRTASDAPYTLVEFADYQCPPCGRVFEELNAWMPSVHGRVRFVFRNLPLTIHPYAYDAAVAAEAAREQGAFQPFHDRLFNDQNRLSEPDLTADARVLHLDLTKFDADRKTVAKARVNADIAEAKRLGLNATPTLILCEPDGPAAEVTMSYLMQRFR